MMGAGSIKKRWTVAASGCGIYANGRLKLMGF